MATAEHTLVSDNIEGQKCFRKVNSWKYFINCENVFERK